MQPTARKFTVTGSSAIGICLFGFVAIILVRAVMVTISGQSGNELRMPQCKASADTPTIPPSGSINHDIGDRPKGRLAFVNDGDLFVLSLADGSITNLTADIPDIRAIAWSPDRQHAVIKLERGEIRIIDVATTDTWPVPTGSSEQYIFLWSPDGRRLAVQPRPQSKNDPGKVSFFDIAISGEVREKGVVSLFERGELEWAPDGQSILMPDPMYSGNIETGYIRYQIEPPRGKVQHLSAFGTPRWSPNGGTIAAQCLITDSQGYEYWRMCMYDPETLQIAKTFDGHLLNLSHVAWSPDSRWLAAIAWDDRSLNLIDLEKGIVKRPTCAGGLSSLLWSPDSRYLIFETEHEFAILEPETGHSMILSREMSLQSDLIAWSPDGSSLAAPVFNSPEGMIKLITFSPDGLSVATFTTSLSSDFDAFKDLVWLQP